MKESSWDEVIATNLKGNFLVLKAAAAMMIRRKKDLSLIFLQL